MKKLIFALIILLLIPSLVYAFPPWSSRLNAVNVWTGTNTFSGTLSVTGLTDGYVPYHVNDTSGLANSPILINTYGIQFADDKASLGLGAVPNQSTGIYEVKDTTLTDLTYRSIHSTNTYRTTANGTFTRQGVYMTMSPLISSGVTDSGTVGGFDYYVERAFKGAAYDDIGTLALLYGGSISYGHNNIGTSSNPTTTTAYGLRILPFAELGTIDTMYDFYIGALSTGGTVTNRWGIYQADTAPNYFAGDITLAGGNLNTGNIPLIIGDNTTDSIVLRTDGGDVTVPEGTITLLDTTTAASTYAPLASAAATGDWTLTDATPTFTLQDSDNAAGTAGFYANSSGGANGINFSLGVEEDAGAANTAYINLNGTADNKVVALQKDLTLLNGDVIRTNATTEGHTFAFQVYDNTANQWKPALTFTNGITGAYKVTLGAGATFDGLGSLSLGGVILGDTTPDAEGETGYASNQLSIHDGTASRSLLQVASTTITKSELIPIEWAEDGATAPAAAAQVGTTDLIARSFAEDADNDVIIYWQLPLDYSAGVKYRVYYALNANGVADETAAFALSGISVANSESLAGAMGTAVVVTDEIGENDDTSELLVSDWSGAVTLAGTPAAGEMAKLTFIRDVSEDDVADHLLVAFIEIKYQAKVNASTDY
jgi:hypothetical protein